MKRDKLTFLIAELILIVLAAFFIHKIFQEDVAQKRVAVILQNSGDTRWEGVINGLKQSAKTNNLHLIICNTDDIVSAQDERELIEEQLENDVDAFILCPAPGTDTKDMLDWLGEQKKPFVLLTEDVYTGEQPEASGYATVKPDNYQIGYTLGTQLITQDEDGLKGKRIGVIAGRSKTEASVNRIQGLKDALEKQDCEIAWEYNEESDTDICAVVDAQESVDYMVVMDTQALDTLGEHAENGVYKDAKIFGVGTSMKSIALLDAGQVQCLVIPDGYGIGYESVEEIEKELTRTFYTLKSHEKEVKVIYKEDLFSEGFCIRMSRRDVKKNMIAWLCVWVFLISLTGCGKQDTKADHMLRVGVVTYTPDDPFINAMTDIIKSNLKAKESNTMKVIVSVRSGDNDQQEQDEIVEEMIDAGCDVLCVNLVDRTAPSNIVRMARQNDIPVIFFNREPVQEDLLQWDKLFYVGCDAAQSGEMQGEIAAEYIKNHPEVDKNGDGKIQYVLLEGEAGHQDAISRTDLSVKTMIENEIELEKLSYQFADWNRAQAENRVSQLIDQYGSEIELILSNNDEMALGAVEAYKNAGYRQAERPIIFGIDGLTDALEAVEHGTMQGTVYNDKEDQARMIALLTVALFRGSDIEGYGLEDDIYYMSQYRKVDADNVDTFLGK